MKKYKYKEVKETGIVYRSIDKFRTIVGVMRLLNLNEKACKIKKLACKDEGEEQGANYWMSTNSTTAHSSSRSHSYESFLIL